MKLLPLVKLLMPIVALCIGFAFFAPGSPAAYAAPADISPSPEPVTRTNTPQPDVPTNTPQPDVPTNTPQPDVPTNTPVPDQPSATAVPPTNTRPRDLEPEKKGVEISIAKTISSGQPTVGGPIEFRLVVNNTGDETAQNVVATDPLPDFLQLVGANASRGTVTISGNTVTVAIGPVGAGDTVTINISAILLRQPSPPNNRNIAELTTTSNDNPNNNRSDVEIRFPNQGSSDASATPALPTDTPLPGVTTTLVPTPSATATPPIPAMLPPTGDDQGAGSLWLVLALIGAVSIGFGALVRRRNAS